MTDHCPDEQALSAFYDGELSSAKRAVIARHLTDCVVCVGHLEQLKRMSALTSSGAAPGLSQIAMKRLHNTLDDVIERGNEIGLVRWAWEVGGIAAAILLVGSIWLAQLSESGASAFKATTAVVPPWVGAQASADPVIQEAPTPAAAWYLADARNASEMSP